MRQPLWLQSPLTAASAIAAKFKIHLYSTNDLLAGLLLFTTISRRTVARVIPLNKARLKPEDACPECHRRSEAGIVAVD
jgi:hypothetical protein